MQQPMVYFERMENKKTSKRNANMDRKTINLTTDQYPHLVEVADMAEAEHRSLANMASLLLKEAIEKRKDGAAVTDDHVQ